MTTRQERRATLLAELGRIHTDWSDEVCRAAAANPVDVSQYDDGWEHYADVAATPAQNCPYPQGAARDHWWQVGAA